MSTPPTSYTTGVYEEVVAPEIATHPTPGELQ
jgi:hypothetical protein